MKIAEAITISWKAYETKYDKTALEIKVAERKMVIKV
jgi:hypothetical protein